MILVIAAGILGLWLAGKRHPSGWGFALAVAAFGLVCLRNYRIAQQHAGFVPRLRRDRR